MKKVVSGTMLLIVLAFGGLLLLSNRGPDVASASPRESAAPPDPSGVVDSWRKAGLVEVGNLGFEEHGRLFVKWSDYDGPARSIDNPIPVMDSSGAVVAYSDNFVGLVAASEWNDPSARASVIDRMEAARAAAPAVPGR